MRPDPCVTGVNLWGFSVSVWKGGPWTAKILTDWDSEKASRFGNDLIVAQHTLYKRPMFSEAGQADLFDHYPREAFGIHTMGTKRSGSDGFRKRMPGKLIGEPGAANRVKTMKRDVGVLISSPNARVFYHLDIPMVTLWHIKGEKTMYVYPGAGRFAPDPQIEAIVLREQEEEIDYDPSNDDYTLPVVMKSGVVASWPRKAPHRLDNSDCVNVSLSCGFKTFGSLVHANALYANGAMRRSWGLNPSFERDGASPSIPRQGSHGRSSCSTPVNLSKSISSRPWLSTSKRKMRCAISLPHSRLNRGRRTGATRFG